MAHTCVIAPRVVPAIGRFRHTSPFLIRKAKDSVPTWRASLHWTRGLASSQSEPQRSMKEQAPETSFAEHYLPEWCSPYVRLARADKPIGSLLLMWPCWWSTALAAQPGHLPDLKLLGTFAIGSFVMRGAGCTINDMWDRDIDDKVDRTQSRPLASGELSMFQAWQFLGVQLSAGLAVLLTLNWNTILVGASSLGLVATYPLMKRITWAPQAYLGLTFNWGALVGWSAVHGDIYLPAVLPLYLAGVSWTMVYDTIYGHQDKEDDVKVGVKSTSLWFGDRTKPILGGFAASTIGCLTLSGYEVGLGAPFYASMLVSASHLAWQLYAVDLDSRKDCWEKFTSNRILGGIVFTGITAGQLFPM